MEQKTDISPEPSTLTLLGIGALMWFGYTWHQRKHVGCA